MKHIKSFEVSNGVLFNEEQLSRVGNHVIINPLQATVKEKKFFNNTIGQIIYFGYSEFRVQYNKKDIPKYMIDSLNFDNSFIVKDYEIILEYKNKEDLEIFIASKKYNL